MKIHLVRTTKFPAAELRKVYEILLPHDGPMEFALQKRPILFEEDYYDWDVFFAEMQKYRQENSIPAEDFLVCVTELANDLNWFAIFAPSGENDIFIHGQDWEHFVYAEKQYPIAFEVVLNVLQRILFEDESFEDISNNPLIHEDPTGCINDLCVNKSDINFKMRTADICSDCLQAFEQKLGNTKLLEQAINILETLRRGMIQSRVFLKPLSFEEKLPFTVAITKRKMGMTSQPFRKFLMMIDHFDCLIRTAVIMLSSLYFEKKDDVEIFLSKTS